MEPSFCNPGLWVRAGLVAAVVAFCPALARAEAPVAPEHVLAQAQKCYVEADLGCALRLLEPDPAWPDGLPVAVRSERLRLLGFAAARLDQHALARRAFAAWVALAPANRLDRASTPPAIYVDYAAAWADALAPQLERKPQLDQHPPLDPPRPTAADLPRYGPPPRSDRDRARDHRFYLGMTGSVSQAGVPDSPTNQLGGQMAGAFQLRPSWSLGFQLAALRWTLRGGPATRALAQLQGAYTLPLTAERLEIVVDGGFTFDYDARTLAALGLGVRYHVTPEQPVSLYVALGDQVAVGSETAHLGVLAVGVAVRPSPGAK
ncbi:MAG: hypothetical protein HY902_16620 [Deltaproteobacteria bacterium]|nr:hypothetical protein [Deltaproteobacteria bacterium]